MKSKETPSVVELSGIDWAIALSATFLVFVGWAMIFASEYNADSFSSIFDFKKNYGRQVFWIGLAGVLILTVQLFDSRVYQTFAPIFYAAAFLLLVGVLFTRPINGSRSWFDIGGFRLQPSEFAKTATALTLAAYLHYIGGRLQDFTQKIVATGIVLLPMLFVQLQGDTGSTLIYIAFFFVLFRAGMDIWIYVMGALAIALFIVALLVDSLWGLSLLLVAVGNLSLLWLWRREPLSIIGYTLLLVINFFFFSNNTAIVWLSLHGLLFAALTVLLALRQWQWAVFASAGVLGAIGYSSSINYVVNHILEPHQQERIWVWLRPEKCDPLGALYNVDQSKHAIGSGGITGKGFLEGERTKLDYVPEQSTDFIFCTMGEEWGWLGSLVLVGAFSFLLLRIVHIAERQRTLFARYYAYGVASILFFHLFINMGMTMGLVPVIGIPLPFISYGGSSLWSFSIMLAILLKLDSDRLGVFGR